jgi:hypothetical protein
MKTIKEIICFLVTIRYKLIENGLSNYTDLFSIALMKYPGQANFGRKIHLFRSQLNNFKVEDWVAPLVYPLGQV